MIRRWLAGAPGCTRESLSRLRVIPLFVALLCVWRTEVALGSGLLVPRDGSAPIRVRSHRVSAVVEDGLARTTLRQTFVNPHGRALEAVYVFPLPEEAALVGVAMEVGGQRLEGFLAERRTARHAYDSLVRQRIDPALVEQVGRSTFRLSVFPVVPNAPTVVELTWIERVPLVEGEYRYVYPLALGGEGTRTEQDFTISVTVRSSVPIESASSPNADMLARKISDHEAKASLERIGAALSEDVVVVARVRAPEPSLAVHVYRPPKGSPFFAAVITPPELKEEQVIPRDVTLVLDVSGSMLGGKMEQARRSGLWLLDHLRAHDRVNVFLFNDVVQRFAEQPVAATEENRNALRKFLSKAAAGGGTALGDAIRAASEAPAQEGRAAMAVIMTDGLPTIGETKPERIVAFARAGAERGLQVDTFGVGPDVDAALLEGVATAGGGRAEVFRPDGEIETRLQSFLARTASPAIVDLELLIDGHSVDELFPRPLPDLYLGEQLLLTGRCPAEGERDVVVTGFLDGRRIKLSRRVEFANEIGAGQGNPIARDLYSRTRLTYLERALRLRTGLSDGAYFAALDRGAYSTEDELVRAVIDLSLETGVQAAHTSFLALLPEDHRRLDPRDAREIDEALKRADARRREIASQYVQANPSESESFDSKSASLSGEGGDRMLQSNPSSLAAGSPAAGSKLHSPGAAPNVSGSAAGGGIRAATGGARKRGGNAEGFERWEFWYEHNRDAYPPLPDESSGTKVLNSPGFFVGRGRKTEGVKGHRPTTADVRLEILPELRKLLVDSNPDVADAAALAIARITRPEDVALVLDDLIQALGHRERTVREAATIGLGVLGSNDPRVLWTLVELMNDTPEGRVLTHQDPVEDMVRAFAAASLGLIGDQSSVEPLMEVLRDSALRNKRDIRAMAILALGLMKDKHGEIVSFLVGLMSDRQFDRIERAQVPIALSKLHSRTPGGSSPARAALKDLLRLFKDGQADVDLLRSIAIAVGVLAEFEDQEVVEALLLAVEGQSDDQVRRLAILSLAEMGARDRDPGPRAKLHENLHETLIGELTGAVGHVGPAYGALALAIYARSHGDLIHGAGQKVLEEFRVAVNPSSKGAMALALGQLGFRDAEDELWKAFTSSTDPSLRGYIAQSLGQMLALDKAEDLRRMIRRKDLEPMLRLQIARSLGLMGDRRAIEPLIECLLSASTLAEAASAARALGFLGESSAIDALLEVVRNGGNPPMQRGFACAALGLIFDKTDVPWNAAFSVNVNNRASFPALAEILDTF